MTKELKCMAGCGAAPAVHKPLPLCALCALEVAREVLPGVLKGALGMARSQAAAGRRTTRLEALGAPLEAEQSARGRPDGPKPAEAHRLASERLTALKAHGVQRVTSAHLRDLPAIVGRSRPWIYMWLDDQVKDGVLVDDSNSGQRAWRFAA